jgi:putative NADH-flavin reductase
MKIALIGATGNAGSRILNEALARNHYVLALARDPSKLQLRPQLTVKKADVSGNEWGEALKGQDVLVSAFNPPRGTPNYAIAAKSAYRRIVDNAKRFGVKRFLMVGGAGSLFAPGTTTPLVDTPNFPPEYKIEASAFRDILQELKNEKELDWVFISPSAFFSPGERKGHFRIGSDTLLVDEKGKSSISMEDFAIAVLDEIEKPAHHRQRFTVGY